MPIWQLMSMCDYINSIHFSILMLSGYLNARSPLFATVLSVFFNQKPIGRVYSAVTVLGAERYSQGNVGHGVYLITFLFGEVTTKMANVVTHHSQEILYR